MFQPIYDIEGGLGWMISGRTLLPEITDHALFREAFEQDNLSVIHKGCPATKNTNPHTRKNTRPYKPSGRLNPV